MAKFKVLVESKAYQEVEIEAEDFDDAFRKAYGMADSGELRNLCNPRKWKCRYGGVEPVEAEDEYGCCMLMWRRKSLNSRSH